MKYIKGSTILFLFIILLASTGEEEIRSGKLSLIKKIKLQIPEPSGLTFDVSKKHLLIVSDNNGKIYKTDLSGKIVNEKIIINADIEGVTIINDTTYAVISERAREIIIIDNKYKVLNIIKTGISGKDNKGFEGIAFIESENIFIVANEKSPTEIYKISLSGELISKREIKFAKDLSGLFYDSDRNEVWILSEESAIVYRCDMNFKIITTYKIPNDQLEGITITKNDMFLVSDKSEILYHFKITE